MARVTLQTIADRVGVSRMTVSNAFSRPDQLSAELRDRVLAVAEELGYGGPDPLARGLRSGRVGTIGVVLGESLPFALESVYTRQLLAGVARATEDANTAMMLLPNPPGHDPAAAIRSAVVDGFVAFGLPRGHAALPLLVARGLPTVFVDGPSGTDVPVVGIDERAAAAALAGRVLALGHRRLLVLTYRLVDDERTGTVDEERLERAVYDVPRERLRTILEHVDAAGIDRDAVEVVELGRGDAALAAAPTRRAMRSDHPPTAVVALSDELALGALETLAQLGVRVPDEVSVTGYDDLPAAEQWGLTTVRQPARGKGRAAVELLATPQQPAVTHLPHALVERATLGPAPPV